MFLHGGVSNSFAIIWQSPSITKLFTGNYVGFISHRIVRLGCVCVCMGGVGLLSPHLFSLLCCLWWKSQSRCNQSIRCGALFICISLSCLVWQINGTFHQEHPGFAARPGREKKWLQTTAAPHNALLHPLIFITEDGKSNGDVRKTKSTWDVYYIIQI